MKSKKRIPIIAYCKILYNNCNFIRNIFNICLNQQQFCDILLWQFYFDIKCKQNKQNIYIYAMLKKNYSAGDPHMYDFLPTTTETRLGLVHVCIGTFVIPDALCLVPCAWRLVVGVRCLVHNVGAWYCLVLCVWCFLSGV